MEGQETKDNVEIPAENSLADEESSESPEANETELILSILAVKIDQMAEAMLKIILWWKN